MTERCNRVLGEFYFPGLLKWQTWDEGYLAWPVAGVTAEDGDAHDNHPDQRHKWDEGDKDSAKRQFHSNVVTPWLPVVYHKTAARKPHETEPLCVEATEFVV